MRNIALVLMYNGTAYHGWQVQKMRPLWRRRWKRACLWCAAIR